MASSARRSDGPRRTDPARVAAALERAVAAELPRLLPQQRWFGDKGRAIERVRLLDCGPFGDRGWLVLVDVAFVDGSAATYATSLVVGDEASPTGSLAMTLDLDGVSVPAQDALDDPAFCLELLTAFAREQIVPMAHGTVRFARTERFPTLPLAGGLTPRRLRGEQSNTSVIYGDQLVVKALRRVQPGITLDWEVGAFLTLRAGFPHVPPLAGAIEYTPANGPPTTLAMAQRYVANHGDGWTWIVGHLKQLPPARLDELSAPVLPELRRLGGVTGALHAALGSSTGDPDFAPEPISAGDAAAWRDRVAADIGRTCDVLRARLGGLPPEIEADARTVLASEPALTARARQLTSLGDERCMKIRVHGDYHLGQTLRTDGGFVVLDFEGEPARPIAERRRKQCVLVDVAGMLRSFDYAAHAALADAVPAPAGERWVRRATAAFLEGYLEAVARAPARLLPASPSGFAGALSVFELDKALYEVRYELDNRPAWLGIPLRGLTRLLARERAAS
jgi:maltose alpha-D-glucosyltransferase / alpha-amylase